MTNDGDINSDIRQEVQITNEVLDSTSGYVIAKTTIGLKSPDKTMDELKEIGKELVEFIKKTCPNPPKK